MPCPAEKASPWWRNDCRAGKLERPAFLIRDAVPADILQALREVFRRSSLSNDGDRMTLLAHPDALGLSDLAQCRRRTRAAIAGGCVVGFTTWLARGMCVAEIEDILRGFAVDGPRAGRALVMEPGSRPRAVVAPAGSR